MAKNSPSIFGKAPPPPCARIVLPVPVDGEFDYSIPHEIEASVVRGALVVVPFGRRTLRGIVVDVDVRTEVPVEKIKGILEAPYDTPLLNEGMLKLTKWLGEYYACSWGEACQAVVPAVVRRRKARKTVNIVRLAKTREEVALQIKILKAKANSDKSPLLKQARVLEAVMHFEDEDFRPNQLAESLGISISSVNTLRKSGWLEFEKMPVVDAMSRPDPHQEIRPERLTAEQEVAIAAIAPALERDEYHTFLLRGVTGSGKTEVYLQVLERVLAHGKSGIVLVPEISLTRQTVRRFSQRLGDQAGVAVLHSGLSDAERSKEWRRITSGEARIVIGPRSAIFAPVKDLGLIIVDEEHEPSFKQENTPRYHARDVAVMRAFQEQAICILGSATPALESMHNALAGRYTLVELKERVMDRRLPSCVIIDMQDECRQQKRFATLSNRLIEATRDAIAKGQQAIFFLNRRGYHTFYQCSNCQEIEMCSQCAVPMSHHRAEGKLICHYCYEVRALPHHCNACKQGIMKAMGIGTEKAVDDLQQRLPDARIGRMDSDTMKKREDYDETLDAFAAGELDVLVGTQMIAKGLDFPAVTVVGVLHADLNLYAADFRAQERTFQLLTQVAGRAGRGDNAGTVFVQSYSPQHPCIEAARSQDYAAFYHYEIEHRRIANYPPFVKLLSITVEARDQRQGVDHAHGLRRFLDDVQKNSGGAIMAVLGPSEAPLKKIRGRHRLKLLVKVKDHRAMQQVAKMIQNEGKTGDRLRVIVDCDPMSML